jgi:hypothetical protein
MEILINILSAFGLSGSAGLNAYLPLLVVSLAARFTNVITLESPWDVLESWWVIGALAVLLTIEFFADKAPAVNHLNDAIQTFVRPTAGAIVFAASTGVADLHPVLAVILGLLVAGSVHAAKSVVLRPAVTATTAGAANPVVSLLEDVTALIISVLAVVLPVLISGLIVLLTALLVYWLYRRAVRSDRSVPVN